MSTWSLAPKWWVYMLKVLKEHVCSSHQHPNVKQHDCKEKKIYKEWSHDSVPCGNVWSGYWSNQNNQTNVSGHALCQENRSKKFMKLERDLVSFFCLWLFCTDEAKLLCWLSKTPQIIHLTDSRAEDCFFLEIPSLESLSRGYRASILLRKKQGALKSSHS